MFHLDEFSIIRRSYDIEEDIETAAVCILDVKHCCGNDGRVIKAGESNLTGGLEYGTLSVH